MPFASPNPLAPCAVCGQERGRPPIVKCPSCRREYQPVLGARCGRGHLVQEEFPGSRPIHREQLQTGLCSDACWDAYLGGP